MYVIIIVKYLSTSIPISYTNHGYQKVLVFRGVFNIINLSVSRRWNNNNSSRPCYKEPLLSELFFYVLSSTVKRCSLRNCDFCSTVIAIFAKILPSRKSSSRNRQNDTTTTDTFTRINKVGFEQPAKCTCQVPK